MNRTRLIVVAAWGIACGGCAVTPTVTGPMEPGTYICCRTIDEIVLDGRLNENSWGAAASTGNFQMFDGKSPSPVRTTAKLVWDDRALYIAFECEDPDIYATLTQNDDALYSQDVVEVFIMNQGEHKEHYLEYEFSPLGVLFDSYVTAPYQGKLDWSSPGLAAGAKVRGTLNDPGDEDAGYYVEIAIPFEGVYARPAARSKDGDKLRMNLYRIDYSTPAEIGAGGRDMKLITWSPTITPGFHAPERFGTVTFRAAPVGR